MRKSFKNKRAVNTRPIIKKIFILTEGNKTERIYFRNFKKRYVKYKLVIPPVNATDPLGLLNYALDIKRGRRSCDYNRDDGDEIFCVFDVDSNENDILMRAKNIADKNKIKLCVSNPCFEIWFLIHFELQTNRLNCIEATERLKRHIENYKKNDNIYKSLNDKQETAVANAKHLRDFHIREGRDFCLRESCPNTQVDELIILLDRYC